MVFKLVRHDGTTVIHKLDGDMHSLTELLEAFTYFLRGCSFYFDGDVTIVDDTRNEDNGFTKYEDGEFEKLVKKARKKK